jgi:hypothetical protein
MSLTPINWVFSITLLWLSLSHCHSCPPPLLQRQLNFHTLLQRLANHHTLELNMRFLKPLMAMSLALLASASPLINITKNSPPMEAEPGRRRGIAYNDPNLVQYFNVKDAQLGWGYNWYSQPGSLNWPSLEYVPMLWGNSQSLIGNWNDAVRSAVNVYFDKPTHLMAFNEPDNCA